MSYMCGNKPRIVFTLLARSSRAWPWRCTACQLAADIEAVAICAAVRRRRNGQQLQMFCSIL